MESQIDQILDPLLSIEALCYGALRAVTLSENLESGISDITTESLIYFCGSEIKSLPSPKLEYSISNYIQRIRELEETSTKITRKYLAILLENLTHGKLLTPRDYLLLTNALGCGIIKMFDGRENNNNNNKEDQSDLNLTLEKKNIEIKELQRKLDHTSITLDEAKSEMGSEIEKLTSQLNAEKLKITALENDLVLTSNELKSQQLLTTTTLSEKQNEIEIKSQELIQLNESLRNESLRATSLNSRILELESQLANSSAEHEESIQKKNTEILELKTTLEKETKRIQELESQVELKTILESSTTEQQELIKGLQNELQESRQELTIVQNELTETQKELSSRSDWISPRELNQQKENWAHSKSIEINDLTKKLNELENQNQELQSEYTSLQEEYDGLVIEEERGKEELKQQLGDSKREYEQALVENNKLQEGMKKFQQDSFDLQTTTTVLQKKLNDQENWISPEMAHQTYDETINSLKSQILQQLEIIETLQNKVKQQEIQIEECRLESSESTERDERLDLSLIQLEKFKEMIQSMKEKNKELIEKNEINEKVIAEKIEMIHLLEGQISSVKGSNNRQIEVSSSNGGSRGGTQNLQTLTLDSPIIFFEIGSFTTRIGVWKDNQFIPSFSCPTVLARPRNKNISAADLTRTASSYSSVMYSYFRENNVLLGNDAWYCCFQHPDGGLRGSLSLSFPMTSSGIVEDRPGFLLFLEYCLSSLQDQNIKVTDETQIILAYKSNYEINDYRLFSDLFFDKYNLSVMCYLHESLLTSAGYHQNSCLVVDIGSKSTSVIPIFESFIMKHCIHSTRVGGEHLTEFLELLIDAQGIDVYSSQLIRRRQEFSRLMKEKYAFVASSFDEYIERYGRFTFDYLQVMNTTASNTASSASGASSAAASASSNHEGSKGLRCIQSTRSDKTIEIQINETFQCNDGTTINISIDRELFYCSEVLFAPFLHETCQNEKSIVEAILASIDSIDESVRLDICQTIILDGETMKLKGLKERLELDLQYEMKKRGILQFQILYNNEGKGGKGGKGGSQQSMRWQGLDRFIHNLDGTNTTDSLLIPSSNIITSNGYEIEGLGIFSDLS